MVWYAQIRIIYYSYRVWMFCDRGTGLNFPTVFTWYCYDKVDISIAVHCSKTSEITGLREKKQKLSKEGVLP